MPTPNDSQCGELLEELDNIALDNDPLCLGLIVPDDPDLHAKYTEAIRRWYHKNFSSR